MEGRLARSRGFNPSASRTRASLYPKPADCIFEAKTPFHRAARADLSDDGLINNCREQPSPAAGAWISALVRNS